MASKRPRRNLIDAASIVFGDDLQRSHYLWPAWVLITASLPLVTGSISAALVWSPWWVAVLIWIPFAAAALALMYRYRQSRQPGEQHPAATDGHSPS